MGFEPNPAHKQVFFFFSYVNEFEVNVDDGADFFKITIIVLNTNQIHTLSCLH